MQHGRDADALRGLTAVDGSLLPALPRMLWALWMDDSHRAAKLHLQLDILRAVPSDATVTAGNGSEREQLRALLQAGRLYVLDRGYADYQLFRDVLQAISGLYRDQLELDVNVRSEAPGLTLQYANSERAPLEHWHGDTFRVLWKRTFAAQERPTFVTFRVDAKAQSAALHFEVFGDTVDATRVERPAGN